MSNELPPPDAAAPRRIRLTVEYDGTAYVGWQVQPNGPSIQAKLEEAVERLTGESVKVVGAGRTDAGVHALGQVAAFTTLSSIPARNWARALTSRLPRDIAVRAAEVVSTGFDPRRDAVCKQYRYCFATGPIRPALDRDRVWHLHGPVDVSAMQAAAAALLGEHDFASFSNEEVKKSGKNTIRTLTRAELMTSGENRLDFVVEGRSFLYNMVRNMAGFLVDVGQGRFSPSDTEALFSARDRQQAGQGAPPQGLTLMWIRYTK